MSSVASFVPLIVLLMALSGCADEGPSWPQSAEESRPSALTASRPKRSTIRAFDSSRTTAHRRSTSAKPNVDKAIAFERPADSVLVTTVSVVSPGTVTPALPLGPGIQRPAVASSVAVTCKPAPTLNLNCPAEAPTPSTCTSNQGLPAGCQLRVPPAVIYPSNAAPACCP